MKKYPPCNILAIKKAILALGAQLDAEAIGIIGSMARGDFNEYSDIDILVVIKDRKPGSNVDYIWWKRIKEALKEFRRGVTVITYSVEGLKRITNWYVLRLASEVVLIYDKGKIKELFDKIIQTARNTGLTEKRIGDRKVWSAQNLKLGERFVLEVKD